MASDASHLRTAERRPKGAARRPRTAERDGGGSQASLPSAAKKLQRRAVDADVLVGPGEPDVRRRGGPLSRPAVGDDEGAVGRLDADGQLGVGVTSRAVKRKVPSPPMETTNQ